MYLAWAVGLLFVVLVAAYLVRHLREASRACEVEDVRRAERQRAAEFVAPPADVDEDTAPAVLTPPEWTVPKNSSSGSGRRR